jgi:3',5'-cyclic AMP phosphodiesterase CpdA
MSLILHLSDLHLGSPSPGQLDYEDKFGTGKDAGISSSDHLAHTLNALGTALSRQGRELDAIVVSGDLTKGNQPDGYEAFDAMLAQIGNAGPDPDRVVVVPGNHDVDRYAKPGTPMKLKDFREAVRGKYRTPLVKGVDYDDDDLLNPRGYGRVDPVLDIGDTVIVALNSADWCWTEEGTTETEWDEVIASLRTGDDSDEAEELRSMLRSELFWLRTKDIPKVDKGQLDALGTLLARAGLDGKPEEDPRLRIAVLHHPIGVVSSREEIKDFEVITNLAAVRTFLYHRGFHLILHGHKHNPFAGWDWLAPPRDDLEELVPRRALVLGAPAEFKIDRQICRLIEVCPDGAKPVAGAPRLRVIPVLGVEQGESLELSFGAAIHSLAQPFVNSLSQNTPWVVEAKTADAAYQQLRDLRADGGSRAVISVVEDPASTESLPSNYPEPRPVSSLSHLVDWWQHPRPEAIHSFSGPEFNHGERLYFGREDSIVQAVRALPSSKAMAMLVWLEEAGEEAQDFPAFTLVQLQQRRTEGDVYIDVVGVFRKQDLDYWWPVNMAELARIQQRALKAAHGGEGSKELRQARAGRLIAMTSIGAHENTIPKMAGTALDRAVDLHPEQLYHLASLAAHPGPNTAAKWEEVLKDIGDREGRGLLIPSIGIQRLAAAMRVHIDDRASARFRKLARAVDALRKEAALAERVLRSQNDPDEDDLDARGAELRAQVAQVRAALRAVVREAKEEEEANGG